MRLVLSRLALAEIDEILGYLSERSPLGAKHVEGRIRSAFDHISRHPEAAERVEQRPEVRRLPLMRYPYVIPLNPPYRRRRYSTSARSPTMKSGVISQQDPRYQRSTQGGSGPHL